MADSSTSITEQDIQKMNADLTPVFAKLAVGDFSVNLPIPTEENKLNTIYAGVSMMIDVVREQVNEIQQRMEEKSQILSNIGDGVVVLDKDKLITFLNPAGKRILGWTEQEALGQKWEEFIKLQTSTSAEQSASSNQPATNYYAFTKDGTRFPFAQTISTLKPSTQEEMTIIVFRNISKEKEVEELQTEFLSIAAHQLRSPLSHIRWNIEYLLDQSKQELPDELKQKLQAIHAENLELISLVNDILGITKLSKAESKPNLQQVKPFEVLNEIAASFEPELMRKQLSINWQVAEEVKTLEVNLNSAHFKQALQNIIANAVKYSFDQTTIRIKLSLMDNQLEIVISDQGIGIPKLELADIFNRFYRATNAVNTGVPGTGLGLFVANIYAKQWDGQIVIKSQEEVGTDVHIYIPLT